MKGSTQAAVNAFEEVERVALLLERKRKNLHQALVNMSPDDLREYYDATTEIANRYEQKRIQQGLGHF